MRMRSSGVVYFGEWKLIVCDERNETDAVRGDIVNGS